MATRRKRVGPIEEFLALPDDEKERIWESYNREIPLSETRPLTPAERRRHGLGVSRRKSAAKPTKAGPKPGRRKA